jgi:hypothetical protein
MRIPIFGSVPYICLTDPDVDPGCPKTYLMDPDLVKRSHKTVEIKVFLTNFADADPY